MNARCPKMLIAALAVLCASQAALASAADKHVAQPAQVPEATTDEVEVSSTRNIDEQPYSKFFSGMEVFEKSHGMAPDAKLRFRLLPRTGATSYDGLSLKLAGDKLSQQVSLDQNEMFSLPMDKAELDDNAWVSTNRQDHSFIWRIDVRTPNLPPSTRRLGDLRLECKVDLTGAKLAHGFKPPAFVALAAVSDPCTNRGVRYPFFAEKSIFSVTLVSGQRKLSLSSDSLYGKSAPAVSRLFWDWEYIRDRAYVVPLWDTSWPDDTQVVIEHIDD